MTSARRMPRGSAGGSRQTITTRVVGARVDDLDELAAELGVTRSGVLAAMIDYLLDRRDQIDWRELPGLPEPAQQGDLLAAAG